MQLSSRYYFNAAKVARVFQSRNGVQTKPTTSRFRINKPKDGNREHLIGDSRLPPAVVTDGRQQTAVKYAV